MENSNKKGGLSSLISSVVDCAALLFGLIAFCMLFVDCVKLSNVYVGSSNYKGSEIVFGNNLLGFSFMNFLAFLFVFAASALVALNFFGVLDGFDFDFEIIAMVLFAVAAILFFLMPVFVNVKQIGGSDMFTFKSKQMAVGAVMAAVLSLLAAIVLGAKQAFNYLVKGGYIKISD